jgi:hypothetical protein
MAFSGGVAIATGLYSCAECRGVARLDAGEIAPPCPACRRPVTWLYLGRGPFAGTETEAEHGAPEPLDDSRADEEEATH